MYAISQRQNLNFEKESFDDWIHKSDVHVLDSIRSS